MQLHQSFHDVAKIEDCKKTAEQQRTARSKRQLTTPSRDAPKASTGQPQAEACQTD
jgi:hypothetical protein